MIEEDLHYCYNTPGKAAQAAYWQPLAPEKRVVSYDEVSCYTRFLVTEKEYSNEPKLVATLQSRKNYLLHHHNLQQYTNLGM